MTGVGAHLWVARVCVCVCRLEATADVLCAVLVNRIAMPSAGAVDAVAAPWAHQATPDRGVVGGGRGGIVNGSLTVRFGYETVEASSCYAGSYKCNVTVSSPPCLQLYLAALDNVVLCSNDPQYLTVSSSGLSLDFGYQVRSCLRWHHSMRACEATL